MVKEQRRCTCNRKTFWFYFELWVLLSLNKLPQVMRSQERLQYLVKSESLNVF